MYQREHTANITTSPKSYPQQSPAKPQNIITFDCRGLEFVEFKADGAWKATGTESGTKFSDIDLTEGEWFDYDEKASEELTKIDDSKLLSPEDDTIDMNDHDQS
ncbi:hypothetical protein LTR78_002016 [Recurvomyces mirabilis]|uniref:Uncharacterized protein n=1 Tax=Recurvomyces mirabilis TaxID=574656 RepID=A0AAE0WTM5_9PEZI|nr:hypothetical protein LTR78_002016 [Recurvomyces mirabilis]KAK5160474.1 hypothetical protein LTS14_001486 [Recurvomyces mirabilis]